MKKAKEIGGSVRVLQKPKYDGKRKGGQQKSTENAANSLDTDSHLNENLDSFPDEDFLGSIQGLVQVLDVHTMLPAGILGVLNGS